MRPIQYLLLAMLAVGFWVYLRFLRSRSRDRLIVFLVFLAAIVFVLMPSWSSWLADAVGVGRGVDLVLYFAITLLGFISLVLYSQLRYLKLQLAAIVRDAAVRTAKPPEQRDSVKR